MTLVKHVNGICIEYVFEDGKHEIYKDGVVVDSLEYNSERGMTENEVGVCFICGTNTNGFMCSTCRKEHKNVSVFNKRLKSYLKIGYPNVSSDPKIKNKKISIMQERYGVSNPSELKEVKEKISKSNSDPDVITRRLAKTRQTVLKKYGVDHYSKTEEYKEKYEKTSFEKFGVSHVLKSKLVRQKFENTMQEKYKVSHPMKDSEIKRRQNDKAWKTKHNNKYGMELSYYRDGWREAFFEGGFKLANVKYPMIKSQVGSRNFLSPEERMYFKGRSSDEIFVKNTFEELLGLKFDSNVRSIIPNNNRLEIDLVDKNNKISIEFNGYYWHQVINDKFESDIFKCESMRDNGWQHLSLDETDLVNLDKLSMIINPNKKIYYARKCSLVELDNKTYKEFCIDNHLQGYGIAKYRYGLVCENELLQVMSFSKDRYGNCDHEMIRLVSLGDSIVIGGSEKLFKHFTKTHKGSIVSYSDNKYFSGKIYHKLNFECVGNTKQSYVWKKGSVVYKRYDTMKHKLINILDNFDKNLTEDENMVRNGFVKIKNLGNKKWVYNG